MKNRVYFFLVVLVLISSCKKEIQHDACNGIVCLNGGTCVDGVCVCDSGWTGAECGLRDSIYVQDSIYHAHLLNISHLLDSVVGRYLVSGDVDKKNSPSGSYYHTSITNQFIYISKVSDTTLDFRFPSEGFNNWEFYFVEPSIADSNYLSLASTNLGPPITGGPISRIKFTPNSDSIYVTLILWGYPTGAWICNGIKQ